MRMDRMITLSLARPLCRALARKGKSGLPILMYHGISEVEESHVHPYYRTFTSPRTFASQMAWLREAGYTGVSLKSGLQEMERGTSANNLVAITFDDGFRDFYTAAAPILCNEGFTATMFLPTAFIGGARKQFDGQDCLIWGEVRELNRAGFEFGSHTVNHPQLAGLSWTAVTAEVRDSKTEIEQQLGEPVTSFAYPFAFPQADKPRATRLARLLRDEGYSCNATTAIGRVRVGDDPYLLKRLPVNDCDDKALFEAKLEGAYDWLAWPQQISKQLKV